jgi:hypothetical protein
MKRFVYSLVLVLLVNVASFAQNGNLAEERAKNLSNKMIRELQLNNFQSRKVKEINLKNAQKMMEFEAKHANNPTELERCINGVCKQRDLELENVLSTAQYSQYFGTRKSLISFDREYALQLQKQNRDVAKTLVAQDKTDAKRSFPQTQPAVIKETTAKN